MRDSDDPNHRKLMCDITEYLKSRGYLVTKGLTYGEALKHEEEITRALENLTTPDSLEIKHRADLLAINKVECFQVECKTTRRESRVDPTVEAMQLASHLEAYLARRVRCLYVYRHPHIDGYEAAWWAHDPPPAWRINYTERVTIGRDKGLYTWYRNYLRHKFPEAIERFPTGGTGSGDPYIEFRYCDIKNQKHWRDLV